jgi:hypothetical protein
MDEPARNPFNMLLYSSRSKPFSKPNLKKTKQETPPCNMMNDIKRGIRGVVLIEIFGTFRPLIGWLSLSSSCEALVAS